MKRTRSRKFDGFTLPEIVTGVTLLVLVALLIIPFLPPSIPKDNKGRSKNACIANLKQIDSAQEQWALEHHKDSNSPTVLVEITAYLKNGVLPNEPLDGTYTIGPTVKDLPKCSYANRGHTI
jgi:competence protein ComGC